MALSLKLKVLLVWFASILATLGIVAAVFIVLIGQYQNRVASDKLDESGIALEAYLRKTEVTLTNVTRHLSEREDVQATLNLISRYQDPKAYHPLAFDPEKEKLALHLREQVGFGTNHIIAALDDKGEVAAYHINAPNGTDITGTTSYQPDGTPLYITRSRLGEAVDSPFPQALKGLPEKVLSDPRLLSYIVADGRPALLVSRAVDRVRANGQTVTVGRIVILNFLDAEFIASSGQALDARLSILPPGDAPTVGYPVRDAVAEILAASQGTRTGFHSTPTFYWTAVALPMPDGERLWFVLSRDSSVLRDEVNVFREALLAVLIFIGFTLLPVAYFLVNRTLSAPIQALTSAVEDMRRDGYASDLSFKSGDELGVLAQRFNEMTAEIRTRQDEINKAKDTLEDEVHKRTQELEDEVHNRRRAETHLRLILDTAADAVITIDGEGIVEVFNKAAEEIFGYKPEEVIGRNVSMLMETGHAKAHDAYLHRYHHSGTKRIIGTTRELTAKRKNGEIFPIELSVSESHYQKESRSYTGIVRDITERKRIETELIDARDAAEAANTAKSEFLSRMSHELRTPMNSIIGFAQLVLNSRKEPLTDKQRQYIAHIEKSGGHLLELINEVLDLARIEAGRLSLVLEPLDTRDLIEECLPMIETQADQYGVTVVNDASDAAIPPILADYTRLKQVMLNLMSNGVKYNRPGGALTLSAELGDGDTIHLHVADTGHGISEDHLKHIFDPFSRLDAEHTDVEGTGIGLTITQKLVESMNGALTIRSTVGEGSVFTVSLPLAASVKAVAAEMATHDAGHGKVKN